MRGAIGAAKARSTPRLAHATLAGLCAILVGIGFARFTYTPLLPALIEHGWFAVADAAYLGAANLAGYLAGALGARRLAAWTSVPFAMRSMMLLASASFFACATPLSFLWFFVWRFASGVAGAVLMVLAAPAILAGAPPHRRGFVGGLIFVGVGIGIIVGAALVPLLLRLGLPETWIGLGLLSLVLTGVAWSGWPMEATRPKSAPTAQGAFSRPLVGIYLAYGLNAVGLVPHMVFLVDFVARGLGQGVAVGALYWILFGVGALAGPIMTGSVADRIGFGLALRLALVVQAAAILLPLISGQAGALAVSSIIVGAFTPGVVPLVLGRVRETVVDDAETQRAAWSFCTVAWALGQAVGAYGLSFLFARTGGDYRLLFVVGSGMLLVALAFDLSVGRANRRRAAPP